jgi:hypothetical protein
VCVIVAVKTVGSSQDQGTYAGTVLCTADDQEPEDNWHRRLLITVDCGEE